MKNSENPYKLLIATLCASVLLILLVIIGWDCYVQFSILERRANAAVDLLMIMIIGIIAAILAKAFKL